MAEPDSQPEAKNSVPEDPRQLEEEAGDKGIKRSFSPIESRASSNRVLSRSGTTRQTSSLHTTRSYGDGHGYTCFIDEEQHDPEKPEDDSQSSERHFEVGWAESDPMDPRGLSTARKWLIVLILAMSSCCVFVSSILLFGSY